MNVHFNLNSDWGKPIPDYDPRALRKFNHILRRLNTTLEWISVILSIGIFISLLFLMFDTNFLDLIFDDGTSNLCVLEGKTGEISYVSQK
jgi:hypothetical protein